MGGGKEGTSKKKNSDTGETPFDAFIYQPWDKRYKLVILLAHLQRHVNMVVPFQISLAGQRGDDHGFKRILNVSDLRENVPVEQNR